MSVDPAGSIIPLLILAAVVLVVVATVIGWDRYRPGRRGPNLGAHPTNEVFIDPETGRRMRVWYDPATGAREYRDD
ncbi:MAG TPA: hypothetical protein VIG86_03345 [Candidatus Dormibacteraeota bacterium]